jgi:ribulose-phosphate 3-epimerase
MSVNPGFGGQKFIPQTIDKIRTLKKFIGEKGLTTIIEVDGGININNAKDVASAGADILVMGSAFFNSGNYKEIMKQIKERLAD